MKFSRFLIAALILIACFLEDGRCAPPNTRKEPHRPGSDSSDMPENPPLKTMKREKRRIMVKNEDSLWGLGQVPYSWATDKPLSDKVKLVIKSGMARISSHTCITFHKWYPGIEKDNPGMKSGKLVIGAYSGCWGPIGYQGVRSISPCKWINIIQHEFGHSLGLNHEHLSPDRNKYLKSYPENWGKPNDWADLHLSTMSDQNSNFGIRYDMNSGMAGYIPRYGSDNRILYYPLDKNAKDLFKKNGLSFLDFKAINLAYKCFDTFCKGQTLTCENEGYPTYAGGKCKCSCPPSIAGDRCEKVGTERPGEVFELTPEKPERIITSQGYPNKYPRGLQQYWLAKVQKGGLVQLDFLDFDVYYNSRNGECIDYMEPSIYGIEFAVKRKFCGSLTRTTVTSKTNYMLIKLLSQSANGTTRFKIKVKGIFPNQLCYKLSDGGTSYRGTVNYTQNYKPCLPWNEVRHCPYNTFDVRSLGSGIAGNNYCRNPSKIAQPWCYTDTDECLQDMCDACLLDRCLDVYDDCAESIASDSDYCKSDPTAFIGCQLSCGFCKTPDPVLRCGIPPSSDSAIILGPRKSKYAVGDVVEYVCKESGIKGGMKRTCLSDGTWSYASSECSGCKTGYEEFDGLCYKFYREYHGFDEAIEKCKSDDPSYYPAAINDQRKKEWMDELLLRQKDKTQYLHTGLFIQGDGKPKWTDGSDFAFASWMPWSKDKVPTSFPAGKVIVNVKNAWHIKPKSYTSSLVCEGKTHGERKCHDRQSDCQQLLERNPDVCLKEIAFARKQCRWSCGVCKDSANPGRPCTAPTTIGEATLIGTKTFLSLGETAQYKCSSGYVSLGHLERVCLADGSLAGTDPKCVRGEETPYVIGRDHLYLQYYGDTGGSMNIHASLKVPKASKAVAFNFYSKHDSQIAFQGWRKTGSTSFVLIGENIVTTKKDRQMYVKIAPEEQILLKKGDYIGWKNLKSEDPPLTYLDCKKKYIPNYEDIFYQVPDAYRKSFQVSESVNFNLMVGKCRNYSLEVVGHAVTGGDEDLCEVPGVSNAIVSHPRIIEEGTKVSIKCLPSYTATTGATEITCLESGLWSAAHAQCYRPKLTVDNNTCVFPFIANGAPRVDCVGFPPWCATTENYDKDEKYGMCKIECKTALGPKQPGESWTIEDKRYLCDEAGTIQPIPAPEKTVDGHDCVFPWKEGDKYYGTCTLGSIGKKYCGRTANLNEDNKWGYCGVTCTAQNGARVHAGDSWKHEGQSFFCNEESKIILIPEPEVETEVRGKFCVLPYFYKEKWYGTCNTIGEDKPWCYVNSRDKKKEWEFCATQICTTQTGTRAHAGDSWVYQDNHYFCNEESKIMPIPEPAVETEEIGVYCGFPYFYRDKWYGTCNTIGEDKPWCSLNSGNYNDKKEWKFCDTQICTIQNGSKVHDGDSWEYQGKSYFCNEEPKIMLIPEPVVETEVEGKNCGFPYFYKEKWYGTCNTIGEDSPWCSLNSGDYKLKKEWGFCKSQ